MFESGVKGYMIGRCEITQGFPIDMKDSYHVACKYCRFLVSSRKCVITDELVPFPEMHIGYNCPFSFNEINFTEENEESED